MSKFIKISGFMFLIIVLFISVMQLFLGNTMDVRDYESKNLNEVVVKFDSKKSVGRGVCVRFRIYNNSRYHYMLDSSVMKFESIAPGSDDIKSDLYLSIDTENSSWNYRSYSYGIAPKDEGYMEFIIPKGISFDRKYFALDSTTVEYRGSFMVEVPLFKGFRIPVEYNSGIWRPQTIE